MSAIDKIKKLATKLWQRVQAGMAGGTSAELETAKQLLEDIKEKHGLTEADFLSVADKEEAEARKAVTVRFDPDFHGDTYKKSPIWFRILVNLLAELNQCKVITTKDSIVCVFIGLPEKVQAFADEVSFVLKRSATTFKMHKALTTGKSIVKADYFHGFVAGYHYESINAKVEENPTEEEKDSITKLIFIGHELVKAEAEAAETAAKVKKETGAKDVNHKAEVKDVASYRIGFYDGTLAKKKLLT
jgi:hypothetical protein